MQIIIPMSGFGERFRRAGYTIPKPLIEIEGKPIVAHVIDMFPGETDFIFICNQEHLDEPSYQMAEILHDYCPTGKVIGIPPHKLGPVHAVLQIRHLIDEDEPAIVNYCDFTCYWNWRNFKAFAEDSNATGIIPAYKGFHPHTLGTTNYAYIREQDEVVIDIQEKQPFTSDRMNEYASSGTYYFNNGRTLMEAFDSTIEKNLNVGGEYYVSLAYKPLLSQSDKVLVYPLQHFMQWGTPQDVDEYKDWSNTFKRLLSDPPAPVLSQLGRLVIPMAGLGQRFANEGYTTTKPLIPVSGKPMVLQASNDLPHVDYPVYVIRNDMPGKDQIVEQLTSTYPNALIETLAAVTDGQARSAMAGLTALIKALGEDPSPVTFGACDNGALYDRSEFQSLVEQPDVDVIVWGVRGHPNASRYPEMFGWIEETGGVVNSISVKRPLKNPSTDPIVIGTFTFRRGSDFSKCVEHLIARDGKVNGEFYIDSCINDAVSLGLKCVLFEVDSFISWGTPNDLKTFEYWQSCFHKWSTHPYSLQADRRVSLDNISSLEERFSEIIPIFKEPRV